jgi:hypothetical protein
LAVIAFAERYNQGSALFYASAGVAVAMTGIAEINVVLRLAGLAMSSPKLEPG